MKVALFTGAVPRIPSGVGDYVHQLYRFLEGKLDLCIITSQHPEVDAGLFPKAQVHAVAVSWGLSDLGAIRRVIEAEKPDLFHQQYPSYMGGSRNRAPLSNLLPVWLRYHYPRTPLVTTFHEFGERRLRWRARALPNLVCSRAVIAVTARDREILGKWKRSAHRIALASSIPARPDLHPARPARRVAYFGLIEPLKGFERFLEAASLLARDGVEFAVLGGFHPERNPYHRVLRDQVLRLGLGPSVRFLGHLDSEAVARELAGSGCCLLPFEEGVSERRSSFVAAVAQRIPIVTTSGLFTPADFHGIRGLFLHDKGDVRGMANRVRDILDGPRSVPDYSVLDALFDSETLGESHLAVYRDSLRP